MAEFEKKTWGSYEWDNNKSLLENVQAARAQNAVIETSDLQRLEDGIQEALSVMGSDIRRGSDSFYSVGTEINMIWNQLEAIEGLLRSELDLDIPYPEFPDPEFDSDTPA